MLLQKVKKEVISNQTKVIQNWQIKEPLADYKRDAIRLWNAKDQELYEKALELRAKRPPLS